MSVLRGLFRVFFLIGIYFKGQAPKVQKLASCYNKSMPCELNQANNNKGHAENINTVTGKWQTKPKHQKMRYTKLSLDTVPSV